MSVLRNLEATDRGARRRASSAVPSPRRSSLWRSPASSRRRWTPTGPPRSRRSTPRTVHGLALDRGPRAARGLQRSLSQELSAYLLEHARRQDYALLTRPEVEHRGRRAPAPRRVRDPAAARQAAGPPGRGPRAGPARPHDGLLGARRRTRSPAASRRPAAPLTQTRAIVSLDDRRYVLDGPDRASLGRSRECDCVFDDQNVSRRHAELRRGSTGDWQIVDLGSTNGVKVNGRRVDTSRLAPGDDVSLGTVRFIFDIEQ